MGEHRRREDWTLPGTYYCRDCGGEWPCEATSLRARIKALEARLIEESDEWGRARLAWDRSDHRYQACMRRAAELRALAGEEESRSGR